MDDQEIRCRCIRAQIRRIEKTVYPERMREDWRVVLGELRRRYENTFAKI